MNTFKVVPTIVEMMNTREFCEEFCIGKEDLIITSKSLFYNYFQSFVEGAKVIFPKDYGNGEPTDTMVEAIAQEVEGNTYNRIIAIGGGSVIDVGKLFCLKSIYPVEKLFEEKINLIRDKELIVVPTTCGTGSEVTNISILEITAIGTKKGLVKDELYANYAVLIPELMEHLPYKFFAISSMDALIHAIESFLSPKATSLTRLYSKTAITKIIKGYIAIAQQGEQARHGLIAEFLLASTYAGIAFDNAGCGAVHALSYPLGTQYHIPHGESNYTLLKGVMQVYDEGDQGESMRMLCGIISKTIGCTKDEALCQLFKLLDCILPVKSLSEYGIKEEDLKVFTESVFLNQKRLLNNSYINFSKKIILNVYTRLYQKGC